ncbi:winged helix-turn-helix transcriptional regulator [Streptomyces sp. NPDC088354]|uniref:winged helix-turn-helix transcriptional regulator n=1 Tax=unclassified Streptomyces TaxID=2593676 RepID=UPI0029B59FA7|nr:helix-turn-helix domain-containing protein [Streptomyces sp. MI02-7b]MDX3071097.1 helix-turn-helix domain-containing protein [Streptomyces sp. MI02-7b]
MKSKPQRDALAVALDAIDDRWCLHIVRAVAFGASRYTDILREVGAPRDVLSSRLRKLTAAGILRPLPPEKGRPAGYELTRKGRDLGHVVLVLKRWGDTHGEDAVPRVDFVHDGCGAVFVAEVRCQACGEPVRSGQFSVHPASPGC